MKKRSVVGIIITVILSIVLLPLIWASGLAGTSVKAVSSVVKEERKEDIYQAFVENEGIEWIYGIVDEEIQKFIADGDTEGLPENFHEIFEGVITKADIEMIADGLYHKMVKGEIYQFELSFVGDRIKTNAEAFFDQEADAYIEGNLPALYEAMDEETKSQIKAEAKKVFLAEVEKEFDAQAETILNEKVDEYIKKEYPNVPSSVIETKKAEYLKENKDRILAEEKEKILTEAETQFAEQADTFIKENIGTLYAELDEETKAELKEKVKAEFMTMLNAEIDSIALEAEQEINATIASFYESPEYIEFMQLQESYGINVYELDTVTEKLMIASYLCYGIAVFFILLLLVAHLFRPSGFFVSGVATLFFGGAVMVAAKKVSAVLEVVMEHVLTMAEIQIPHESLRSTILEAMNWLAEGFSSSSITVMCAGAALTLVGVLLLVIRRNKAA